MAVASVETSCFSNTVTFCKYASRSFPNSDVLMGIYGLAVSDDETTNFLLNACLEVQFGVE